MRAVNHLRFLGGGESEPHVFRCDDRQSWVLKLPGNPRSSQLGNDYIGLTIAARLAVPVPETALIQVDWDAIGTMDNPPTWIEEGLALGTRYEPESTAFSLFHLGSTVGADDVARLLVCDSLVETLDRRRPDGQWNLLVRTGDPTGLLVVDFGYCVQAMVGSRLGTVPLVPASIGRELQTFADRAAVEEAVQNVENFGEDDLRDIVSGVHDEWMRPETRQAIGDFLIERRRRIVDGGADALLGG